jgi:hypothetical protein
MREVAARERSERDRLHVVQIPAPPYPRYTVSVTRADHTATLIVACVPRRPVRTALGVVLLLIVLVVVGVAGALLGVGASLTDVSTTVSVQTEQPTTTTACVSTGPPPGHASILVRGEVHDTLAHPWSGVSEYRLVVRAFGRSESISVSVVDSTSERVASTVIVRANDSTSAGDRVSVELALRRNGRRFDTAERTATVRESDGGCAESVPVDPATKPF